MSPTNGSGEDDGSGVRTVLTGLQGLVGAAMVLSGATKLAGAQVEEFERYGYPQWLRVATGGMEVSGGLGLLAGLRRPTLAVGGGALVSVTMIGAAFTHLVRARDPPVRAIPATVLFGLAAIVTKRSWTQRGGKRNGGHHD